MADCEELMFLTAAQQGRLIARREISPVDLVETCLARIERHDSRLRAYITVCADAARAGARRAQSEIVHGRYRGPLHGIPYGVKDQICTAGVRTTLGSRVFADWVPEHDAVVVERLAAAGAILIGKENLHELGKGGTNLFPFGQPRNPWNTEHTPASSSSGSGIAPAAGFSSGSLGEDTGGSIRGPAAACGVVGLRPTYGRVPRHGGVMHAWTGDTIGPITRSVEDNALFLQAIAGRDARDPLSSDAAVPDYRAGLGSDLRGLRLAVVTEMTDAPGLHPEVRFAFEQAVQALRALGAQVGEVSLPLAGYAVPLQMLTSDVDVASRYLPLLRTRWHELDVGTRTRMAAAALVPAAVYGRAMRARVLVRRQMLEALGRWEGLLAPTALKPPPLIDDARESVQSDTDVVERIIARRITTHPFAVGNLPALALPMGFSAGGLPLSLQIAGRPFDEPTLYRIGHAYEQATSWHTHHPDLERTARSGADGR